jgi:probable H4MPT-linked C1 transfer pathway protein
MMCSAVLALDVGGANLKAAHSAGAAYLKPFELWKNPAGLADALQQLMQEFPAYDLLVVTMTGELCDCFETKRQGVQAILDAVEAVARDTPVRVWQTDGKYVDLAAARKEPLRAAAANWLALATFAGRFAPAGSALVVDVGSTTTDIVPLFDGRPVPFGRTDLERLRSKQLVYMGVRRTPVCALLGANGAAEWFATTLDVYLVLGDLPENWDDRGTADGRPATKAAAQDRLARMLCADRETCSEADILKLATEVRSRQVRLLRRAVERVSASLPDRPRTVVIAGSGEFLARSVFARSPGCWNIPCISLADKLGARASEAACAYALAVICCEQSRLTQA